MLTRAHRLTSSREFGEAIRSGRRFGRSTMVVYLTPSAGDLEPAQIPWEMPVGPQAGLRVGLRVGLVVSKSVGNAVTRNRVKRRLRELVRQRLRSLPGSGMLVVRALPAAATASYAALGADLDAAISRLSATVSGTSASRRTSDSAS